jgi:ribosome-associated protein
LKFEINLKFDLDIQYLIPQLEQTPMIKPPYQRYETDIEILKKEVIIETYKSRGPGGQRKNKAETAVRLTHLPSGVTLIATEYRSQAQNRKLAFERLQKRILRLNRTRKRRIPTSIPFGAIEKRKKEKRLSSAKKRLRRTVQKESEDRW